VDISPPPPPEDLPPPPPAPAPPYSGSGSPYDSGAAYGAGQPPYGQPSPYTADGAPPYGAGPGPYPQQPNPYQNPNPYAAPGGPGTPGPYPAPYPYQSPQGWYAAERTTNGLSIASLVTSFTCVPLLGIGLGIGGLKQGRRQGQRGRGLAIAGITINSVTTLLVVLLIVLGATGALDDGNTEVADIKAGQCFNTTGHSLEEIERGERVSRSVNVVDCAKPHDAEAFYTYTLDPSTNGSYPGEAAITSEAQATCGKQMGEYLDGRSLDDGMRLFFFGPQKSLWDDGDRTVTCFFGDVDAKVTGSVRDGGGSSSGGSGDGGSSSDGGSSEGGSSDGGDTGGVGV
jgi:hypothetical protein